MSTLREETEDHVNGANKRMHIILNTIYQDNNKMALNVCLRC